MSDETREGYVIVRGEDYATVALRVKKFRETPNYLGWTIDTNVIQVDEVRVVIHARIIDPKGRVRSTGTAEEKRTTDPKQVNFSSALENAETSAVGRALAFLDAELMGKQIASADEMVQASVDTKQVKADRRMLDHQQLVRSLFPTVATIKRALADATGSQGEERLGHLYTAAEAFHELSEHERIGLWVAPTKGGIFTTREREAMRSQDFLDQASKVRGTTVEPTEETDEDDDDLKQIEEKVQ